MEALTLFDAPARRTDPETSKAAARTLDTTSQRVELLRWLHARRKPLTRDVLSHLTDIRPDVAGTRLNVLARQGLVCKAGTAPGDSGVDQTTWQLTDEGRWFCVNRLGLR